MFGFFFSRTSSSRYLSTSQKLETEYIKQLQEQIYYLEQECLYLYPFSKIEHFLFRYILLRLALNFTLVS